MDPVDAICFKVGLLWNGLLEYADFYEVLLALALVVAVISLIIINRRS